MAASSASATELLKTPLYDLHLELGARMVPFAGYSMPVQYPAGLMAEHKHTREAAGLFDISHMGQLRLVGPDAAAAFETLMPVDVIDLPAGKQRYGLLLNDEGGILDDLMFFNEGNGSIFVIVNGACKVADIAHIQQKIGSRCEVRPLPDHALLALQGPQAAATLARLSPGIERFVFMTGGAVQIGGIPAFVTRSGYTGEDGFEIGVAAEQAEALWNALAAAGVKPAGLGARDTLRLEAGMNLYGNDMDETVNPLNAGLAWTIDLVSERDFIGKAALLAQGQNQQFLGLILREKGGVLRSHQKVIAANGDTGEITSGTFSPTMQQTIALARLPMSVQVGDTVHVEIRDKKLAASVVKLPFVRNGKILAA